MPTRTGAGRHQSPTPSRRGDENASSASPTVNFDFMFDNRILGAETPHLLANNLEKGSTITSGTRDPHHSSLLSQSAFQHPGGTMQSKFDSAKLSTEKDQDPRSDQALHFSSGGRDTNDLYLSEPYQTEQMMIDMDQLNSFLNGLGQNPPTNFQSSPSNVGPGAVTGISPFVNPAVNLSPALLFSSTTLQQDVDDPRSSTKDHDHTVPDFGIIGQATPSVGSFPAQIDELVSWGDVSFFISLFIRLQHPLVPICHQPSFAKDMLHRRDQRDESFRGFVLSIGGCFLL